MDKNNGQKRMDKREAKLDPTCHKFRLTILQRSRIDKLKLGDYNLMDFIRASIDFHLDHIETTGQLPDLPKRASKVRFAVGDAVLVGEQIGEILGQGKKGWYRILILDTEEIKLAQAKNMKLIKKG